MSLKKKIKKRRAITKGKRGNSNKTKKNEKGDKKRVIKKVRGRAKKKKIKFVARLLDYSLANWLFFYYLF